MKAALTHPTWNQIEQGCFRLALQISQSGFDPDCIVALIRGGAIPAVRLSHLMGGLPVLCVNYSSTEGNGDDKNHVNELTPLDGFNRILIVDDICDTGLSLNEVYNYYTEDQSNVVCSAVLYHRQGAVIEPTFKWETLTPTDPWIHFPWEA